MTPRGRGSSAPAPAAHGEAPAGRGARARRSPVPLLLAAVAALAPVVLCASYVARFAVDVPYYDEWRFVPLLARWDAGTLGWRDVFAQHDGHRIPLCRLAMLASVRLTGWNVTAEVWLGFGFLAGAGLLLAHLHWRSTDPRSSTATRLLSMVPLLLVVFSLRQWENLLGPWGIAAFGVSFFALLAFVLAERGGPWSLVGASCSAAAASLCFTNGLLVWPIVTGQLLAGAPTGEDGVRRRFARAAAWLAISVAFLVAYLTGYEGLAGQLRPDPWLATQRFVAAVGAGLSVDPGVITGGMERPLTRDLGLALPLVTGVLVLALGAAVLARTWRGGERTREERAVSAAAAFALGSVAMLAAGRASLGVAQAVSSRYATPVAMLLAAILLLPRGVGPRRGAKLARWCLVVAVVASSVVASAVELQAGRKRRATLRTWAQAVRSYRTADDAQLANPHFPPQQIRAWSAELERRRLSVFRDAQP